MATFLRIERPTSATLRPRAAAASMTCCTRWMFDAKLVTITRPSAREKTSSRCGPTTDSDGENPGRSALVESPQSSRIPPRPAARGARGPRPRRRRASGRTCSRRSRDRAELAAQRDGARIGNRMGHVDQLELERAEIDLVPIGEVDQLDLAQLVLPRAWRAPSPSSAGRRRWGARRGRRSRAGTRAARRDGPRGRA